MPGISFKIVSATFLYYDYQKKDLHYTKAQPYVTPPPPLPQEYKLQLSRIVWWKCTVKCTVIANYCDKKSTNGSTENVMHYNYSISYVQPILS